MKKVLSVILAMLMLCSAFAVPSFAASSTEPVVFPPVGMDWWATDKTGGPITDENQALIVFSLNGGTLKNDEYVYDFNTDKLVYTKGSDISGTYYMVPVDKGAQIAGQSSIQLPAVTPMTGKQFDGWYLERYSGTVTETSAYPAAGSSFGANSMFKIPAGTKLIVYFSASYSSAEQEVPTMTKVMNILFSVFGTIIAVLTGKTKEEVVATLKEMFGDILG